MSDVGAAMQYFRDAMSHLMSDRGRATEFLIWVRNRKPPSEQDPEFFLSDYTFIVSASGFRESFISRRWPKLREAMHGFDLDYLSGLTFEEVQQRYMDNMLRNRAKAKAVAQVLTEYSRRPGKIRELLERLERTNDVDVLRALPYMGDALKYHMARNMGLDVAKPDVWLIRLAERFGYSADNIGVQALCGAISQATGERVGAVDFALWAYARFEAGDGSI